MKFINLMATRTSKEWSFFLGLLGAGTGLIFYLVPRTDKGAHLYLFGLATVIYPFLALVLSKGSFGAGLTRACAAALYWFGFYTLFVDYLNHPWGAGPETNACDGPCFGWYSFENEACHLCLVIVATVSLLLGLLVLFIRESRAKPAA